MSRFHVRLMLASASLAALLSSEAQIAAAATPDSKAVKTAKLPLLFFANQGQLDASVKFAAKRGGLATWFTANSMVVDLAEAGVTFSGDTSYRGTTLRYTFEGASTANVVGEQPNEARFNFLKGSDPSTWRTNVPTFGSVRYDSLYPGVDLLVRDASGVLEYDLVLAPGASLDQVRIRCEGAESLSIDSEGCLVAQTQWGELKQRFPQTWVTNADGTRTPIDSKFVLLGDDSYGFAAPDRDPSQGVVVDPGLSYSSFIGGSDNEHGCGVSVDQECALFIAGDTKSIDFPTVTGSYDVTHNGDVDIFASKTNAVADKLVYSTFLGGTLGDFGHGVIVDSNGFAYITGGTKSTDYPVTPGAFDPTHNGQGDTFVTKLSVDGASLLYSTFVGGVGEEGSLGGQGIAVNGNGEVYVAGFSGSPDYPVTVGAYGTTFQGVVDVSLTKLNATGTGLIYSTFIGGTDLDIANGIDVDATGAAYIGGWAISSNYPTTPGAFASVPNGNSNGIISKISPDGSTLVYSTFTGGSSEVVRGVAVEGNELFATGYTLSSVYPATVGAYDTTPNGNGDAFVMRFNPTGTGVAYASYLGGIEVDVGNGIDTDVNGQAYVTGWTESLDYPVTALTAYDSTYNGAQDAFCTRFLSNGSNIDYSSYVGGSGYDVGFAMNVHDVGAFYMAGGTFSGDFPTTVGAYDQTLNGLEDIFMVLMPAAPTACVNLAQAVTYGAGETNTLGSTANLVNLSPPKVPNAHFSIKLTGATANAPAFVLFGKTAANATFDSWTLLVTPDRVVPAGVTDAGGQLVIQIPIGDNSNFCDDNLFVQMAVIDPLLGTFYNVQLSNGLQLTLGL